MILLSPYSRKLRNGKDNPKHYPYWPELIEMLDKDKYDLIQVGAEGEKQLVRDFRKGLPFEELKRLLGEAETFIGIDNFFHHLASYVGKRGIVLWGQSDPKIFGDELHINLLKGERYLRIEQFDFWENAIYRPDAFVRPEVVISALKTGQEKAQHNIDKVKMYLTDSYAGSGSTGGMKP
jgi:hypothetical protein